MSQAPDRFGAILCGTLIICSVILAFTAFRKTVRKDSVYVRERWASRLLLMAGILGIISQSLRMSLDLDWIVVSRNVAEVARISTMFIDGILLGFLVAVISAGQLRGTKQN